jgi:hypothetical protein
MFPSQRGPISSGVWVVGCAVLLMAAWASAQSESGKNAASPAKAATDADKVIMTPERQAAAMKFAELHHPELHQLLEGLKRGSRAEYQQAVRQLYHDSERLARLKERAPFRYDFLLAEWQLDSRLRLLVARMTMSSDDPELEAQLQELLKKRLDNRLALLKGDRERQAARLAKLDDQIHDIESDRESAIQKDLLRIQRSLGITKRPQKKPPNEPSSPNPPKGK